eukprot:350661-Chlamydomonas_euryale.AAC.4
MQDCAMQRCEQHDVTLGTAICGASCGMPFKASVDKHDARIRMRWPERHTQSGPLAVTLTLTLTVAPARESTCSRACSSLRSRPGARRGCVCRPTGPPLALRCDVTPHRLPPGSPLLASLLTSRSSGSLSSSGGSRRSNASGSRPSSTHSVTSSSRLSKFSLVTPTAAVSAAPRPPPRIPPPLKSDMSVAKSVASTPSGQTRAASTRMGMKEICECV